MVRMGEHDVTHSQDADRIPVGGRRAGRLLDGCPCIGQQLRCWPQRLPRLLVLSLLGWRGQELAPRRQRRRRTQSSRAAAAADLFGMRATGAAAAGAAVPRSRSRRSWPPQQLALPQPHSPGAPRRRRRRRPPLPSPTSSHHPRRSTRSLRCSQTSPAALWWDRMLRPRLSGVGASVVHCSPSPPRTKPGLCAAHEGQLPTHVR